MEIKSVIKLLVSGLAVVTIACQCSSKEEKAGVPSVAELQKPFGRSDRSNFQSPAKIHYPETWFHYIGGNVSLEGITADLEAIADAGISGVQLFHGSGGKWPATGEDIACLSENWDSAVKYTADECRRLGLRFTMQNCPGWAMSGGPWIKPENAMRTLIYSRVDATGQNIEVELPQPQPSSEEWRDYKDIAVLAFPRAKDDTGEMLAVNSVKGSGDYDWKRVVEGNQRVSLKPTGDGEPHWVEMRFAKPSIIRSLEFPGVENLNHNMCYEPGVHLNVRAIKADGSNVQIVDADLPMSAWQGDKPLTFACVETEDVVACKIEIRNAQNINLGKLKFYSASRKNSWESEAGWTLRAFERTGDDVKHSSEAYVAAADVVDISKFMTPDGKLQWKAPKAGDWTILRVGHVNEGKKNAPAPPEGTGWECDKLSTEGPEAHFAGYIGRLLDGALQGGALNGMLLDSWECASQLWTTNMEQEFVERSGYELRKWIPALFGYVIDSPEVTSRFLLDWRRVRGDLFANKFYRRMAELGHENGLTVAYETAAGDVFSADIMEYFKYADIPMCEFWHPYSTGYVGSINFKPIKPTASAARMYGKPRVAAESFTSFDLNWDEHLEMLKEFADYHFVEGVTHNVFHTYTHNPQIDYLKPGTSFGQKIGTPFLRGQTWWPHVGELTTYLARCSYMLERGRSVSDVLWYLGDEISHKPDQLYPFPQGYKYDYCNPDVLLNRLSVKDGMVVTPEGLSYKFIWIPENKRMLPESIERLYSLVEQGATVVANAPTAIATLAGGEQMQQRYTKAVEALWGAAQNGKITTIGQGRLLCGVTIEEALQMLAVQPDVKGNVRWLHRQVKGADWYFVTPEKQSAFSGEVEFQADGAAELWNPVTGEITPLAVERRGEYAVARLDMPQSGSCFVVFNHNAKQKQPEVKNYAATMPLSGEWTVSFPEGWGAPAELKISELKPWCELPVSDEGKAFSGTAKYTTTFNIESKVENVMLDLGKVDMVACVKVNGQPLRKLWCAPYSLDISDVVKQGENTLEIEVTSTWYNRLAYDAAQPEAERKTWTISGPAAGAKLRASGLMGPVALRY
ncbi:MAG: hypothetical protein J6L01_03145 [Alistipes sp.]|nr:hypothetical protein [Alistipes sp.]